MSMANKSSRLCRILGTKYVTCLYIDKFAPFHNKMSVFHNIFVKFLQTIYFYTAESARKIDAQVNFNIQDVSWDIWGRKVNFWTKKYKKKVIGPSYFTAKLSVFQTTSDTFRTIWAFKTRELVMNDCFAIQRYRALNIIILFISI